MKPAKARLVYSSEGGRSPQSECRKCGAFPCRCEPARSLPPPEQSVRVRREKGGRGGKVVTVAGPLVLTRADATALLAAWKKLCGGGGALKSASSGDGGPAFELEVQGDHADRIVAELVKAGYKAKRAGG
jgi:translation initiation factor 1